MLCTRNALLCDPVSIPGSLDKRTGQHRIPGRSLRTPPEGAHGRPHHPRLAVAPQWRGCRRRRGRGGGSAAAAAKVRGGAALARRRGGAAAAAATRHARAGRRGRPCAPTRRQQRRLPPASRHAWTRRGAAAPLPHGGAVMGSPTYTPRRAAAAAPLAVHGGPRQPCGWTGAAHPTHTPTTTAAHGRRADPTTSPAEEADVRDPAARPAGCRWRRRAASGGRPPRWPAAAPRRQPVRVLTPQEAGGCRRLDEGIRRGDLARPHRVHGAPIAAARCAASPPRRWRGAGRRVWAGWASGHG